MTMDETPSHSSREPQQVIDALADLFDAVAPERSIEAEEELIAAGRDPDTVAAAMRRVAEGQLGVTSRSARPLRRAEAHPSPRLDAESRGRVEQRARTRWRSLALLAAGFVGGILVSTWLTGRSDDSRPWTLPSVGSSARRALRVPGEPGSEASLPRPSAPQGPPAVLPNATGAAEPAPATDAGRGELDTQAAQEIASPAEDSLRPLPSAVEGSLGVIAELGAKTWELAVGRMPPELLRHYRDGEWWHTIHELSAAVRLQDPALLEAGEAQPEQVRDRRARRDRRRSERQAARMDLRAAVPGGRRQRSSSRSQGSVELLLPVVRWRQFPDFPGRRQSGAERGGDRACRFAAEVRQEFWDGFAQPLASPNPDQALECGASPDPRALEDLEGNSVLTRRYRDPTRPDDTWLYLPSLRRVRRLAPPSAPMLSSSRTSRPTMGRCSTAIRPRSTGIS